MEHVASAHRSTIRVALDPEALAIGSLDDVDVHFVARKTIIVPAINYRRCNQRVGILRLPRLVPVPRIRRGMRHPGKCRTPHTENRVYNTCRSP